MTHALITLTALVTIAFAGFLFGTYQHVNDQLGGASPNMQARLLSEATTTVGHQTDRTLFTEKEYCSSRVISTLGVPIFLSFKSSSVNPKVLNGHIQLASTTVAYDAALYGCGAIVAAATATTTVAIAEYIY